MSTSPDNESSGRHLIAKILIALLCAGIGAAVGFTGQALVPVKVIGALPTPDAENGAVIETLPKVFWLKKSTSKTIGNFRARERAIMQGNSVEINDREVAGWINDAYMAQPEPTEELDAKIGTPFVRIGGQLAGTEADPILTVTTPFKVKIGGIPVMEIPLQFVARPEFDGQETSWTISDMRAGHAKIPDIFADNVAASAVREIIARAGSERINLVAKKLASYRRVAVRDHKLVFDLPLRPAGTNAP